VALNLKQPLPSLVATDSENIQTQGPDAKDTKAFPTPATGLRDSDREEISNRIRAIQNSVVALQTHIESAGGQALIQDVHAHIRDIKTYLVAQNGQDHFRSEQANRRHTYLMIGVRSSVYRENRPVTYEIGSNHVSTHSYDKSISDGSASWRAGSELG
jgi:hypothetical protein